MRSFGHCIACIVRRLNDRLHCIYAVGRTGVNLRLTTVSGQFHLVTRQTTRGTTSTKGSTRNAIRINVGFREVVRGVGCTTVRGTRIFNAPRPRVFIDRHAPRNSLLILHTRTTTQSTIGTVYPRIGINLALSLRSLRTRPNNRTFTRTT